MNRIIRGGLAAAAVAAATIALAAPAMAYTPPAGHTLGEYIGTNGAGTITQVDMNLGAEGSSAYYHEYDLTYTPGVDGVITFTGVGMQYDNNGESISGVIDTTNRTITFTSLYYTGTSPDGRAWGVTNAPLAGTATSGPIDWQGDWSGINWVGTINVPNFAPVPVVGNHGQYVSGAAHAGFKGKALAEIARDAGLVGPYTGPSPS